MPSAVETLALGFAGLLVCLVVIALAARRSRTLAIALCAAPMLGGLAGLMLIEPGHGPSGTAGLPAELGVAALAMLAVLAGVAALAVVLVARPRRSSGGARRG
jgi:hypothetical protein